MPRHALVSMLAMVMLAMVMGLVSLPAASQADDIKSKAPETAFSGKLRPDILGISNESTGPVRASVSDGKALLLVEAPFGAWPSDLVQGRG